MHSIQKVIKSHPLVSQFFMEALKNKVYPIFETDTEVYNLYFPKGYSEASLRKIVNWWVSDRANNVLDVHLQIQNNCLDRTPEIKALVQKEIDIIKKDIPSKINEIMSLINQQ